MARSEQWRCGKAHHHFGEHGDWVRTERYKREKWRCGMAPEPPPAIKVQFNGVTQWNCPEDGCERVYLKSGPARAHWYSHLFERNKHFDSEHGTEAGYSYHRKQLKEDACDACLLAHRLRSREWARQWRRGHMPNR